MHGWKKRDRARCALILDRIFAQHGGPTGVGEKLGQTKATVSSWKSRGRVPVAHIKAVLGLLPDGDAARASELHPNGKFLEPQA